MTRETKVGLIFGLGVILLVGIFISDYLNDLDRLKDESLPADFAEAGQTTTNQSPALNVPPREPATPSARDLAAAALEQAEQQYGTPDPRQPMTPAGSPPPRMYGPGVGSSDIAPIGTIQPNNVTPPAVAQGQPEPMVEPRPIAPADPLVRPGPDYNRTPRTAEVNPISDPDPTRIQRVEHTVKEGETLTAIARRYYNGDENMWRSIRDANPGKVGANGEVNANATLVIPVRSGDAQVATADDPDVPGRIGSNTPAAARSRMLVVTVKDGDTLSGLAATHMGSAGKWRELLDANADVLTEPENLRVGMRLRIPSQETEALMERANEALATDTSGRNNPTPTGTETPRPAETRTYTVVSGDNLYRIAAKTLGDGNRFNELYEANRDQLSNADDIRVGVVLKIPTGPVASVE